MALDTRIPLMGGQPDVPGSPMEIAKQEAELNKALAYGRQVDLQTSKMEEEKTENTAIMSILRQHTDASGMFDDEKALPKIMALNPEKGLKLQRDIEEGKRGSAREKLEKLKLAQAIGEEIGNDLTGIFGLDEAEQEGALARVRAKWIGGDHNVDPNLLPEGFKENIGLYEHMAHQAEAWKPHYEGEQKKHRAALDKAFKDDPLFSALNIEDALGEDVTGKLSKKMLASIYTKHDESESAKALEKVLKESNSDKRKEALEKYKAGVAGARKGSGAGAGTNRSYMTAMRHSRDNYEKRAAAFLDLVGVLKSNAYGTAFGDQSMIDKIVMIETGRVPTEAQYAQLAERHGMLDLFDIHSGKFKHGAILSETVRHNILDEGMEQAKLKHEAFEIDADELRANMIAAKVDPETVISMGGQYEKMVEALHQMETQGINSFRKGASKIPVMKSEDDPAYDKLPSGAKYIWNGTVRRKK
jgi:hypothetical protein